MNKNVLKGFIFYGIDVLINLIALIVLIVFAAKFKLDYRFYCLYLGIIIFLAVFNMIWIMVMELAIKEYQYKKFSLIMHPTYAISFTCAYYVYKHFNELTFAKKMEEECENYTNHQVLYLAIPTIILVVVVVACTMLNFFYKEKPKEFDPKKYLNEKEYNPEDYLDKKFGLKEDENPHQLFNTKKKKNK